PGQAGESAVESVVAANGGDAVAKSFLRQKAKGTDACSPARCHEAGRGRRRARTMPCASRRPVLWIGIQPVRVRSERDSNPRASFRPLHDFQSCSLDQLGHHSVWIRTELYHVRLILSM